jgi:hypothetical protein
LLVGVMLMLVCILLFLYFFCMRARICIYAWPHSRRHYKNSKPNYDSLQGSNLKSTFLQISWKHFLCMEIILGRAGGRTGLRIIRPPACPFVKKWKRNA